MPGIGQNVSCTLGDCLASTCTCRPEGRLWPGELWFSVYSCTCTHMYIWKLPNTALKLPCVTYGAGERHLHVPLPLDNLSLPSWAASVARLVECAPVWLRCAMCALHSLLIHVHVHIPLLFTCTCTVYTCTCTYCMYMYMYILYVHVHVHTVCTCTCTYCMFMYMYHLICSCTCTCICSIHVVVMISFVP